MTTRPEPEAITRPVRSRTCRMNGGGTVLDQGDVTGAASPLATLDWTEGRFSFDTSAATNGNVTLRLDLPSGGYAAFDNFRISASDTPGIPVPASLPPILFRP